MEVLTRTNGREMTLAISGDLDHHGAHGAMQQIDHALDAALPLSLTMDLSGVSFMDSSGIAVVLRAHRRMAALGGSLIVTGAGAGPKGFRRGGGAASGHNAVRRKDMKKSSNYIKLEFLSRSTNEGFARSAVAAFASQLDPTLDELGDIKTAVSEAVTNAIVHAYPDTLGKIVVRVRLLDGGVLEIAVYDWGRGIADVEKAREPLFTTGGEERSGMGFTIMESFMDTLKVRSRPGKGTVVTMRKRIAQRAGRA